MINEEQHQEWKKDLIELHEVKTENKKLQKQSDLLTLGLLQEKNKVAALNKKMVAQAAYIRELETKQP